MLLGEFGWRETHRAVPVFKDPVHWESNEPDASITKEQKSAQEAQKPHYIYRKGDREFQLLLGTADVIETKSIFSLIPKDQVGFVNGDFMHLHRDVRCVQKGIHNA